MITVEDIGCNRIKLSFNYYMSYIARVKELAVNEYDSTNKCWYTNVSCIPQLERLFHGELFYKTPKWKILGEPMPKIDMSLPKTYDLPPVKNGLKPFKYQEYGYQFFRNKLDELGFALLADGCGIGKTNVAIMTFYQMFMEGEVTKLLILAKKSIKKQWIDEFKKFTDIENYMDMMEYIPESATKKKRAKMYDTMKNLNSGILVTTYQSCLHDLDSIKKAKFDICIIDEAHILRTVNGKMNISVEKALKKTKYKLLLTGTPIMARPKDMYALLNLCTDSNKWFEVKDFKEFEKNHVIKTFSFGHPNEIGYKGLDKLRDKCQSIVLRRTENEVEIELPDTINNKADFDLDGTQARLLGVVQDKYDEIDDKMQEALLKAKSGNIKAKAALLKLESMCKGLIACKQAIANDPRLLGMSKSKFIDGIFKNQLPRTYKMSEKTEYTISLCENILEDGKKVIIFSKFERVTRMLKEDIEKALGVNVLTYTGALNEKARFNAIDLFKDSNDYNILIGTDSLAEGVNCQASNYIIHYDLPDTVAIKTQRVGRARRASSTFKTVHEYILITKNTVDENNLKKLDKQKNLFGSLVGLSEEESKAMKKVCN